MALPPLPLPAFAPALARAVGPPGAAILDRLLHRHLMLGAPPLPLAGGLRRWLRLRGALEHCFQPHEQAGLVMIAQGQVHHAAAEFEMDIHAGGSLWQRLGGWAGVLAGLRGLSHQLLSPPC